MLEIKMSPKIFTDNIILALEQNGFDSEEIQTIIYNTIKKETKGGKEK